MLPGYFWVFRGYFWVCLGAPWLFLGVSRYVLAISKCLSKYVPVKLVTGPSMYWLNGSWAYTWTGCPN